MKPFMLRHKFEWLPNKLQYGATYWIGFIAVSHEGFTFKLSRNSKKVSLRDNSGERFISKRELKDYFKGEYLQFATEIEPKEDCEHSYKICGYNSSIVIESCTKCGDEVNHDFDFYCLHYGFPIITEGE